MHNEFFTTKNGSVLSYQQIHHHPKKTTFIFLHGLGGDLGVWQPLADRLDSLSFNYLLIDLPGHGLSSKINPSTKPEGLNFYIAAIAELINHLQIKHPIIVGHCFGGNIALMLSQKITPKATITINTTPKSDYFKLHVLEKSLKLASIFFPPHQQQVRQVISRQKHHFDFDLSRIKDDIQRTGVKSYCYALKSFAGFTASRNYTPLIAILGEKDHILPYQKTRNLYRQYTHATVYPLNDNHLIPLNQSPETLVNLLLNLLTAGGIDYLKP